MDINNTTASSNLGVTVTVSIDNTSLMKLLVVLIAAIIMFFLFKHLFS